MNDILNRLHVQCGGDARATGDSDRVTGDQVPASKAGEAVERAYRDGVAHGEAMRRYGGLCYGTYAELIAFRNGWMRGVKNRYAT